LIEEDQIILLDLKVKILQQGNHYILLAQAFEDLLWVNFSIIH